jgi:hypothetical protein
MEDACVILVKFLSLRHDAVKEFLVEGKISGSSQKPAVAWGERR